jgi:hypothetical protein
MSRLLFWPALLLVVGGLLSICLGGRPAPIGASIEGHRALLINRVTEVVELYSLT